MTEETQKQPENAGATQLEVVDGGKVCGEIPPYAAKPIRTVKDAKRMLSKLIHAFQLGTVLDDRARTLCYLIVSYVTIIRDAEHEGRIRAIEHLINQNVRKGK